jgi:transcriptional regulator of acetoin/glycerol metabolism
VSTGPSALTIAADAGFGEAASYTDLKKRWSDSFEREYLVSTLNKHHGNVSAAARESKLDRSNFLRLLRRHGLKAQEYRGADHAATEISAVPNTGSDKEAA